MSTRKPCGHPDHPEDGNIGIICKGAGPSVLRGDEVKQHQADPWWFVGRFAKLGFPTGHGDDREYMWVRVTGLEGAELRGLLKNTPVRCHGLSFDDVIGFKPDEIIDVYDEPYGSA